jgi:heat shock 70kDa protein 1/2/6/8
MDTWPFKVIDDGGNPKVEVEYLGETKSFSPQEISAMVLTKVYLTKFRMPGSH